MYCVAVINRAPHSRVKDVSISAIAMGLLAAIVGFTGSFTVVLQGFRSAGASEAEAASALMALTVGMGVSGIMLAWRYRMPIGVAWSTPGSALLISSGAALSSVNVAIGAYLFSAVLLIIAGVFRPLGRLIEAIPSSLANAMLAGVLLMICVAPVQALASETLLALPVVLTWYVVGRYRRMLAVPAALLVLVPIVLLHIGVPNEFAAEFRHALKPAPIFVMPQFEIDALVSIGIPLFVVTMASQNVPGIAVLRANGYTPKAGPLITNTGIFSLLAAPFGSHGINLAAITAAMMSGADSHPDASRRYWAAVVAGFAYILMGLLAGAISLLVTLLPQIIVQAIAGLALLGSFTGALVSAFAVEQEREAAAVTFLFAASGLTLLSVGGAFWGLLVGGAMLYLLKRKRKSRA